MMQVSRGVWGSLLGALLGLWCGSVWAQTVRQEMVAMADGKKLSTTVVLPTGNGPWPVLLQRTPYAYKPNTGLASAGIVTVTQHTRGRFQSQGEDRLFGDDRADGAATVAWIRKQSWCNGVVVSYGGSALGITQLLMAEAAVLDGQFIVVGATDLYSQGAFWGGVLRHELMVNWSDNQARTNHVTPPHPTLLTFLKNPLSTSPQWARRRINSWSKIKSPGLHVGGWYDIFSKGTLDSFVGYKTKADPSVRDQQILIMGPWVHGVGNRKAGELTYPANAQTFAGFTQNQLNVAWLTKHLLKQPVPQLQNLAPVNLYLMGDPALASSVGNRWLKLDHWPPLAKATPVYLRQGGLLSVQAPSGAEPPDSFSYDPKNPVPTKGGNNLTIAAGAFDQRSTESRKDVLVFTSSALSQAVPVIGRIQAKLWVSSDAKDTDFSVKLTDVYPDGRSMLVLDGIVKLRHHKGTAKEQFVPPNTPVEVTVDLWSTAIVFEKGHKIRVAISSSNAPRFQPNPNTGEALALKYSRTVIAKNTVYHDKNRPSRVIFPVVDLTNLNRPPQEPAPEPRQEPLPEAITDAGAPTEPARPDSSPTPDPGLEPTADASRSEGNPKEGAAQPEPAPTADRHSPDAGKPPAGCGCQSPADGFPAWLSLLLAFAWLKPRPSKSSSNK